MTRISGLLVATGLAILPISAFAQQAAAPAAAADQSAAPAAQASSTEMKAPAAKTTHAKKAAPAKAATPSAS